MILSWIDSKIQKKIQDYEKKSRKNLLNQEKKSQKKSKSIEKIQKKIQINRKNPEKIQTTEKILTTTVHLPLYFVKTASRTVYNGGRGWSLAWARVMLCSEPKLRRLKRKNHNIVL